MNLKKFLSVSAISVIATVAGITLAEVYVGPTDTPENYNVKPPVNVSSAGQVKIGSLALPNLVIGTDIIFKGDANAGGSKVGIGNTDPSKKLDVTGDINFTGDLYKNGLLFFSGGKFVDGDDTNDAVYTTGNVGIGITSPNEKLDVDGVIKGKDKVIIGSADNAHYGYFEGRRNDGLVGFFLGYGNGSSVVNLILDNASRFDITGKGSDTGDLYVDGSVGIGTSTMTEKLNVDGNIEASGYVYSESDRRLKKNIKILKNYRDILKINAVSFDWKKNKKHDVGIIAQNVNEYFPEFVIHDKNGIMSVSYAKLAVPMLNLLQEQEGRLNKQEKEIQELKEAIKKLQNK